MNKFMNDTTNEFAPDSPEAYQAAQANGDAPLENDPGIDDLGGEAPAGDVPPAPPAPAPEAPAPAPAAPVSSDEATRKTPIAGLKEDENLSIEGIALATKQKLAAEPKVRMMIPLDPGEKAGAYRTVLINGYRFDVRKNTMVDLPQSVAALLTKSYSITSDVVENHPNNLAHANAETQRSLGVQ